MFNRVTRPTISFVLMCCLSAMLSCSDDNNSNNSNTKKNNAGSTLTVTTFPKVLEESLCDYSLRCCEAEGLKYTDRAGCIQEGRFTTETLNAAPGSVGFDSAGAQKLLDDMKTVSCAPMDNALLKVLRQLEDIYTTTKKVGESCDNQNVATACIKDLYCNDGVCAEYGQLGADCSGNNRCVDTLYCDNEDKCAEYAKVNDSCETAYCGDGLYCNNEDVCKTEKALGESCDNDERCGFVLYCINNTCTDTQLPEGQACKEDYDCQEDLRCFDDQCAPRRAAGGECDSGSDCEDDLTCVNNKCATPLAQGAACVGYNVCQYGLECEGTTRACQAKRGVGEPCRRFGNECLYSCGDDGVCLDGLPVGAECESDRQCKSNECDFDTDKCIELKVIGEPCSTLFDCKSGACSRTTDTCIEPLKTGDDCRSLFECASRLCENDKCLAQKANDATCEYDENCQSGKCSDANVCVDAPKVGDTCESSFSDCPDNAFCDEVTGSGSCMPRPCTDDPTACSYDTYCDGAVCLLRKQDGDSCADAKECKAEQCTAGVCGDGTMPSDRSTCKLKG